MVPICVCARNLGLIAVGQGLPFLPCIIITGLLELLVNVL